MACLPLLDLHYYHEIDRNLFTRMVVNLSREPAESLLAMAFWFWLEDNQCPSIVASLLDRPDFVVNKVIDEAILCLNSLAAGEPIPPVTNTAYTTTVLEHNVPLELMHQNKTATINGIKYFISNVCARIFTDILNRVLAGNGGAGRQYYDRLNIPGFPHPIFGDVTILYLPLYEMFPIDDLWGWQMP